MTKTMDGTEKLCNILYGVNMGAPKHYLGGSNALMLHDAADKIAELQAQLDEANEVIVCLKTDMPMADRLLNQRTTINNMQAQLEKYEIALNKLARLGNGDHCGTSDGNRIAQQALHENDDD